MSVENIINNPPEVFKQPCEACGVSEFQLGVKQTEERIIKSLDIERTGSHALDDLIDTLIFMNISRSDFKRRLIELIKGETK